jgi:eukaryotic-like serine/threonine-protein kinase
MTADPGDRQVRSLLLTMSGRTPEERLDALRELAVTDPELASQLTILITQTGAYEQPSPPSPVPFDPGLPSRFQIVARIGQGGFGTVFKAYDRERQTVLALKVLHRLDSDALYRFKQEFRSLADLRHPNLIRFYDLFQHNDAWFFTMELVVGQSILDYVRPGAQALFPRLRDAFHELISVISWLHRRRLIHRDLKPGNILVNERGQPVVLDFGLALHLGPGSHSGSLVVGTPAYMAPEQVSKGKASGAIDWYAVGVILYQALTGKLPFEGDMPRVLLDKVTLDPAPPAQLAPDIPPEWNDLCLRLLSREQETRVAVAERLLESASIQTAPDAPSPMLVGREDVLELLFDACTGAPAGKASVIELTGPSGYGKTKILDAFVAAAADRFPEALIVR